MSILLALERPNFMDNISIIHCNPLHAQDIRTLGRETFRQTYAAHNTETDLQNHIDHYFQLDLLEKQLDNPHIAFLMGLWNQKPVSYLKLNFGAEQTDLKDQNVAEIERIYVLQTYHGKGLGKHMLQAAFDLAHQAQKDFVWLGVWQKNPKAIAFYESQGFIKFGTHTFTLGTDVQMDDLMKYNLQSYV